MAQKRPAVGTSRPRGALIYRHLAAWARSQGYRAVKEDAVHHWVTAGLLPKAQVVPTGFGTHATVQPAQTGRQLLALCRYHYKDKLGRYDLIGAQLWLDTFDVPCRHVQEAVKREFGRAGRPPPDIDDLTRRVALQRPVIAAAPGLSFTDRLVVIDELLGAIDHGERPSRHGRRLLATTAETTTRQVDEAVGHLPGVLLAAAEAVAVANDEDLLEARTAWSSLIARAAPDPHKNPRTRARNRLGFFVAAFVIDRRVGG